MKRLSCFLMPTALLVVFAGCDRSGSADAAKDGESRTPQKHVRSTSSDGVSSMLRVDCDLSLVRTGGKIVAELVFKNASEVSVGIPYWNLIADGRMTWRAFEVSRGVTEIAYTCMMVKRAAPTDADRVVLGGGATHSSRTTISECYDFTVAGRYRVQYKASISVPDREEYLEIVSSIAELSVPVPRAMSD